MTPEDVRAALAAAGLTPLLDHLDALARPAIHLTTRAVDQAAIPVGSSQVGGQPDLPPGAAWPAKRGTPMSFVAQIRLEEAHPYDTLHLLPATGLLSFFYDAQQATYGTDPSDREGFRALYAPPADLARLQRQSFPAALPTSARFIPCAVSYSATLTLAQEPPLELPGLAWTPDQQKQYESALASLAGQQPPPPRDQLLGIPDTLQDDMRVQCQLASHGVSIESAASDPRTESLASGAANWQLLLQMDSDGHAGMRWADAGMLYYWIERDALSAASFDNVWAVLQSD
jgi:uncharacterized protein YwqG